MAAGAWIQVSRTVFLIAASPTTGEQRYFATTLALGECSLISHRSGLDAWALSHVAADAIDVTVPRNSGRMRLPGVRIHYMDVPRIDRSRLRGIPVTTPTRTLIDAASLLSRDDLEEALDEALRRKLTSLAYLARRLDALRGRRGAGTMRALLAAYDGATPDSVLERRFLRILIVHGFPTPVRQYPVATEAGMAYIDLAYPDAMIAIETDGYRFHSSRRRWKSDGLRRNRLTVRGWDVLHVTWEDLHNPAPVLGQLREMLNRGR